MKININTKYDIDDVVYTVCCYHEFIPTNQPCIIKNILLDGDINNMHIIYEVEQDDFIDHIPENWLFSTYAECTKWCEKHNKIL